MLYRHAVAIDLVMFVSSLYENTRSVNLVVKRTDNGLVLPGGSVKDEFISDTIKRVLETKVGVTGYAVEQLYTFAENMERDYRERGTISVSYFSMLKDIEELRAAQTKNDFLILQVTRPYSDNGKILRFNILNEDNSTGAFVSEYKISEKGIDFVAGEQFGFDHIEIIALALSRIGGKIKYTDVAFDLLPETFTLREIEEVFEFFTNSPVAQFKRFMGDKLVECGKRKSPLRGRDATLFTRNKEYIY